MYNAPPQYQPTGPTGVPQTGIDWGVIGESFKLLFAHWQTYCIASAALLAPMLPFLVIGIAFSFIEPAALSESTFIGLALALIFLGVVTIGFQGILAAGITNFTMRASRGLPVTNSDLWVGFRKPWTYFGAFALVALLSTLGVCACIVGTYVVYGVTMFVWPILLDKKCGVWDALSQSWEMLKSEWLMATLFYFVVAMVAGLGVYACYVGILLSWPYLYIAPALLYNRYMGYGPQIPYNPASPYPRGQQTGSGIGGQPPPPYDPLKPQGPPQQP